MNSSHIKDQTTWTGYLTAEANMQSLASLALHYHNHYFVQCIAQHGHGSLEEIRCSFIMLLYPEDGGNGLNRLK